VPILVVLLHFCPAHRFARLTASSLSATRRRRFSILSRKEAVASIGSKLAAESESKTAEIASRLAALQAAAEQTGVVKAPAGPFAGLNQDAPSERLVILQPLPVADAETAKLLQETAKEIWRRQNPERVRLPKNFDADINLKFYGLEKGSTVVPLMREQHLRQLPFFDHELDQAAQLLEKTIQAAGRQESVPARLPRTIIPLFGELGKTLREDELKICELVNSALLPHPKGQGSKFSDILANEKLMAVVFEDFVRNFYRVEQSEFSVRREHIQWDAQALTLESAQYLPEMHTDVTLRSKTRTIVIDTKYYPEALVEHHSRKKIRSDHLYQLYAYLKNCKSQAGSPEGILLYPTTSQSLDLSFVMGGNELRVKTLQLDQPWQTIHTELCNLLTLSGSENRIPLVA
jgi:hypothetical protein